MCNFSLIHKIGTHENHLKYMKTIPKLYLYVKTQISNTDWYTFFRHVYISNV